MKITTITLSPAIDVHCYVPELVPAREHLAGVTSRDVGGKGINISRALTANHIPNIAFVVLGDETASTFSDHLSAEGIAHRDFVTCGRVRENITIHTDDGKETRISFSDSLGTAEIWKEIESSLLFSAEEDSIVTITGRVPDGIPLAIIKDTVRKLRAVGVKVVIDSRSFTKNDLIECKPWLIKPNQEEIGQYTGKQIMTLDEAISVAREFHRLGIDNMMLTLGTQGAVLACESGCFAAVPPTVSAISTVGAGDSTIAGFLAGAVQRLSPHECLSLAVAYGTASCLTRGTRAPLPETITKIHSEVKLKSFL